MRKCYLLLLLAAFVFALPATGLSQEAHIEMRECLLAENGVIYFIWACAGQEEVNDFEICVFDEDGDALEFISISSPPCWYAHTTGNCGYWETVDNPILPGECLDEFDFKVPPGNCTILVRWRFTWDGMPVTDWMDTWITCWITEIRTDRWGSIKALYRD